MPRVTDITVSEEDATGSPVITPALMQAFNIESHVDKALRKLPNATAIRLTFDDGSNLSLALKASAATPSGPPLAAATPDAAVVKSLAAEFVKAAYEHREQAKRARDEAVQKSGNSSAELDELYSKAHDDFALAPINYAKAVGATFDAPIAKCEASRAEMIEKMVLDHGMTRATAELFLAAESSTFKALNAQWRAAHDKRTEAMAKAELEAQNAMAGLTLSPFVPVSSNRPRLTESETAMEARAVALAKQRGVTVAQAMRDALHSDVDMKLLYQKSLREREALQKGVTL